MYSFGKLDLESRSCKVCDLNQCQYNLSHQIYFSISGAIEKTMNEFNDNGTLEKAIDEAMLKVNPPDKS